MRRTSITAILAGLTLGATVAAAQSGTGFLLGTPDASLAVRGGYDHAFANSDIFAESRRLLTIGKNDFSSLSIAADFGIRISDRFDAVLGSAYSGSSVGSEYIDFVDNNDRPIEQRTRFQRVPITASLKAYLAPRGRTIGQFAWVPARLSPYVGVGGGTLWYRYQQVGDFIDFASANQRVFSTTLATSHWTPEGHLFAGGDYTLTPALSLTAEARYTWARGPVDAREYEGFHRIDLSGIAATAGLAVRF